MLLMCLRSGMSYGASVSVEGDIVETKLHRDGIEMQCKEISLICPCNEVRYRIACLFFVKEYRIACLFF